MTEHDGLHERGRALEDEYFRKRDQELIEKLRKTAVAKQARQDLEAKTGQHDPSVLQDLQELGFTPDTISLLPLVPLVQVAWAERGVTAEERVMIVRLARTRGITEGSAADNLLSEWLRSPPPEAVFSRAGRLIRAMLASGADVTANLSADDLVQQCEAIAKASGGIFGLGSISGDERTLLSTIAADLKARQS